MDAPRIRVACVNPNCPELGKVRTANLPHLGEGLYAWPSVVCGCRPQIALYPLPDELQPEPPLLEVPSAEDLKAAGEQATEPAPEPETVGES